MDNDAEFKELAGKSYLGLMLESATPSEICARRRAFSLLSRAFSRASPLPSSSRSLTRSAPARTDLSKELARALVALVVSLAKTTAPNTARNFLASRFFAFFVFIAGGTH